MQWCPDEKARKRLTLEDTASETCQLYIVAHRMYKDQESRHSTTPTAYPVHPKYPEQESETYVDVDDMAMIL